MRKNIFCIGIILLMGIFLASCGEKAEETSGRAESVADVSVSSETPESFAEASSVAESSAEESDESVVSEDTSSGDTERVPEELPPYTMLYDSYGLYQTHEIRFDTLEELLAYIQKKKTASQYDTLGQAREYSHAVLRNEGWIYLPESDYFELFEEKSYGVLHMDTYTDLGTMRIYKQPDYTPGSDHWDDIYVQISTIPPTESVFSEDYKNRDWTFLPENETMLDYLFKRTMGDDDWYGKAEEHALENPLFCGNMYCLWINKWMNVYVPIDETHYIYLQTWDFPVEEIIAFLESVTLVKAPLDGYR